MPLTITSGSHLDHHLTPAHIEWMLEAFQDRVGFFIQTMTLPDHLAEVPCGIYGPSVGDEPVPESEVTYIVRGARKCASRVVDRPSRMTRTLTVIGGPTENDGPCVLYTAYGGPLAPREPGCPSLDSYEAIEEARAFWKQHALVLHEGA